MDPQDILDTLVESRIVGVDSDDEIHVTETFEERIDSRVESIHTLTGEELEGRLRKVTDDEAQLHALVPLSEDHPEYLATFLRISDEVPDLPPETRVLLAIVLRNVQRSFPPASGVPDSFVPVHGDQLDIVLPLCGAGVLYVWREDCEPCDTMKDELETILAGDEGLVRLAVFGPDWVDLLRDEYDVTGGPTTLFVRDGAVDARLLGAHVRNAIENELDKIRDR